MNGINLLEAKSLKVRPTSDSTRASMTKHIFNKIGAPSAEWDLLAKTALGEVGQGHRLWLSDGGSITPWRVEFYLREVGVTMPAIVGVISQWSAKRDSGTMATYTKKVTDIWAAAILKARDIAKAEASLAKKLREESAAKAAAAELVEDGEDGDSAATRSCATGMTGAESEARSQMSNAASVARSEMSNSGKNPDTEADGARLSTKKVSFMNVLDYQSVQYGVPVLKGGKGTMSLNEVDHKIEKHDRWTYPENVAIDIRNGGEVLLHPISSRAGKDGRAWWRMVVIGDDLAKHEEWNSVQMVWGMDAYSKSSHGNLGDPSEVMRRAQAALKRREEAQADARETVSSKTFTVAQQRLFEKLNKCAKAGLESSAEDFDNAMEISKFDSGEVQLVLRTFGYITEQQFQKNLGVVAEFFTVLLLKYNEARGGLALRPFQAAMVAFCSWNRMIHVRNGATAVVTLATFTPQAPAEQMMPDPLAGESPQAATSTFKLVDGNLVSAPVGGAVVVRPKITNTTVLMCALANMKALMLMVHARYFVSEVFRDLEARVSLAVQRAEVGDGCFEATLLLAQVFASLPESLARHVRLTGSSLQFTHALTTVQLVGIDASRSKHMLNTMSATIKLQAAVMAANALRMDRMANSITAIGKGKGNGNGGRIRQNPKGGKGTQAAVVDPNAGGGGGAGGKGGQQTPPAGGAYPGGKGGGGRGKGKGKGKGAGRAARPLAQVTIDALKVAYPNDAAASFDTDVLHSKKMEWLQQWPDATASKGHCFFKEKLLLDCVNPRCPACT